jgi:hypothetical protein
VDLQLQRQYKGGAAEQEDGNSARIAEVEVNPRRRDSVAAGRGRRRGGSRAGCGDGDCDGLQEQVEEEEFWPSLAVFSCVKRCKKM